MGAAKMTRWLRRNGFGEIGKATVDRLMRDEQIFGVIRGAQTTTTIGAKPMRSRFGPQTYSNATFTPTHPTVHGSPILPT
ncbi:MAG: transposase [Mycobacteriales bacterium]